MCVWGWGGGWVSRAEIINILHGLLRIARHVSMHSVQVTRYKELMVMADEASASIELAGVEATEPASFSSSLHWL